MNMQMKVLGSSSKGNCYILDNGEEALVIECGLPYSYVQRAMCYDMGRICGVLVSHEHGDHAKHAKEYAKRMHTVLTAQETADAIGIGKYEYLRPLTEDVAVRVGKFAVKAFRVVHDAVCPYGFLIYHEQMGNMLFATDTCGLLKRYRDIQHYVIEANYATEIITKNVYDGNITAKHADRVRNSHMNIQTVANILHNGDKSNLINVVLIHLSDNNADEVRFKAIIQDATIDERMCVPNVYVAKVGMSIDVNRLPF